METAKIISQRLQPVLGQLRSVSGLPEMFERCFLNTLETTVTRQEPGDTFIITGDIEAMWLRDSGAQVWPYVALAPQDEHLRKMLAGSSRDDPTSE